ncbi:hypothetical protein CPC08DRAFT_720207 [Agrocybe pediades]|nr:hypothetical protein CPC08DRAFT_720207 [Agrocybe pediades]
MYDLSFASAKFKFIRRAVKPLLWNHRAKTQEYSLACFLFKFGHGPEWINVQKKGCYLGIGIGYCDNRTRARNALERKLERKVLCAQLCTYGSCHGSVHCRRCVAGSSRLDDRLEENLNLSRVWTSVTLTLTHWKLEAQLASPVNCKFRREQRGYAEAQGLPTPDFFFAPDPRSSPARTMISGGASQGESYDPPTFESHDSAVAGRAEPASGSMIVYRGAWGRAVGTSAGLSEKVGRTALFLDDRRGTDVSTTKRTGYWSDWGPGQLSSTVQLPGPPVAARQEAVIVNETAGRMCSVI